MIVLNSENRTNNHAEAENRRLNIEIEVYDYQQFGYL